jgi:hypothetical protein
MFKRNRGRNASSSYLNQEKQKKSYQKLRRMKHSENQKSRNLQKGLKKDDSPTNTEDWNDSLKNSTEKLLRQLCDEPSLKNSTEKRLRQFP